MIGCLVKFSDVIGCLRDLGVLNDVWRQSITQAPSPCNHDLSADVFAHDNGSSITYTRNESYRLKLRK